MNPPSEPPTPADAPDDGPTPQTLLYPELTADEARSLDPKSFRIMERRSRVMSLYRKGRSMGAIAVEVGCSVGTVSNDIHAVLDGYLRWTLKSVREHVADGLQRLAEEEAQLRAEVEKSQAEAVETFTETTVTDGKPARHRAWVKKRRRPTDHHLFRLLFACWDRRCKLLGLLDAPAAAAAVPVKIVAGFDPVDRV